MSTTVPPDPMNLLPHISDVLASSTEPSEESGSTLETLDSAYDEEALDKLMGRYEQLSARYESFSDRGDGRRDSADGAEGATGRDRGASDDVAFASPNPSRPSKRQRRGGRRANKDAGFEGRLPATSS